MNKRIYLITGPSGAGKSTVAAHLAALGHATIDADSTQGIGYYVNKNGKPVPYPAGADAAWWLNNNYIWELDRLRKLIDATNPSDGLVFLAGNAANISKAKDMFEAIFYLDLPEALMIKRLAGKDRENSFGQRVEEQAQLVRWVDAFQAEMTELGAITIDAKQPVAAVAADIITKTKVKA